MNLSKFGAKGKIWRRTREPTPETDTAGDAVETGGDGSGRGRGLLFGVCGMSRISERAQEHCVQVAVGQSYETSRDTQNGEAEGVAFTGTKGTTRRRMSFRGDTRH